ncbi:hypothetical protein ACOME3_001189 [Neoechinorhynchus agilis]
MGHKIFHIICNNHFPSLCWIATRPSMVSSGSGVPTKPRILSDMRLAERHVRPEAYKGHCLVPKIFRSLKQCVHCRGLLWGFTLKGYQCSECGISLHKQCARRRTLLRCRPEGSILHGLTQVKVKGRKHLFEPFNPIRFMDFCNVDGHVLKKSRHDIPKRCKRCKVKVHASCENLEPPTCGFTENESKVLIREQELNYYAIKAAEDEENVQSHDEMESL